MPRFLRQVRSVIAASLLAALVFGAPSTAFAKSAKYSFQIANLQAGNTHRFPAKANQDKASSGNNKGKVTSDATSSSCSAAYGFEFKRNISKFPDYRVFTAERIPYCSSKYSKTVKLTKGHKYYFQVVPLQVSPVVKSTVWVKWSD